MSKLTIDTSHVYVSRGEEESVKEALEWVEEHMSDEDEETGESSGPAYTPADLIVYAVRRLRALHKDGKRHSKGKLPSRFYAPRLDMVEKAPAKLTAAVEAVHAAAPEAPKPAVKPRKAAKVKAAPGKPRAAARQARLDAKAKAARAEVTVDLTPPVIRKAPAAPAPVEAPPAPAAPVKAKGPVVRKAPRVHVPGAVVVSPGKPAPDAAGGAEIPF